MCCGDLLSLRWWCPQLENMEELSAEVNKVRALAAEKDREINRLRVRAVPHNLSAVACTATCVSCVLLRRIVPCVCLGSPWLYGMCWR